MDSIDQRARRDSDDRPDLRPPAYPRSLPRPDAPPTGYTLMVAGQRTGKTSFLRLLLDTSAVSPFAPKDQLASVAKFVQGCAGHTAHIRTVSIDVQVDSLDSAHKQPVTLTLVDTPSLDVADQVSSERIITDMLRHVDSKFLESVQDDYKAQTGDHHVHLCIYFLDPDDIVPPHVPSPPAPLVSRTRTNSLSIPDPEPVILEPPVTTNPLLCRPTLPMADISAIRRLSARVNVLPVVARADTLTNDRLAAIKMAIRRDLAEAGIGFGIFDLDTPSQYQYDIPSSNLNGDSKLYAGLANGSSSSSSASSPTTPVTPFLRLPFALISPDIYSHSDGVTRTTPSRHELVLQYTPTHSPISNYHVPSHRFVRGKFTRSYRWGVLDVLDHNHCDFLPLRHAIFHHMQTLQKYTREYLLDKYRIETSQQRPTTDGHMQPISAPPQLHPLSNAPRPIVTIEAAQSHAPLPRHVNLPPSRQVPSSNVQPLPPLPALSDSGPENSKALPSNNPKSARQRTKKITVACNFCRSRKLKCDGGRPACHQCLKRSNACDYMAPQKRRGGVRQRRQFGSDSDAGSGDDPSVEMEPSQSPEILTKPLARAPNPFTDKPSLDTTTSSYGDAASERHDRDDFHVLPPLAQPPPEQLHSAGADRRGMHVEGLERPLPSLAFPPAPPLNASAPPMLPPIRPADEESAPGPIPASAPAASSATQPTTQRKRASTVSGKGNRSSSNYGPKVVACNFCRARKTKCDGAHPTCSSCTRRSLPCNYVNDSGASGGTSRRKASAAAPPSDQGSGMSTSTGPSSGPPATLYHEHEPEGFNSYPDDREVKRERGEEENYPVKRIRVEGGASSSSVAVFGIP